MLNRRSFLIASGLTALASTRVLGANDTLRIGIIGAGGRMRGLLDAADKVAPYQIVAVSDVYVPHRDAVKERSKGIATTHLDYREVLDKDVDAVIIASPDHWHVRMAVDALAAGKDVYLEKPVTHTLEEGATLTRAVRSGKRILQCGMQQRSWTHFRDAVDLIQGGSLGRVTQVRTYWWQNYHRNWPVKPIDTQALDWKLWLGSAPDQPFSEEKYNHWRWFWNFGGGAMTDLFTHWIDVVHWAMKVDQPARGADARRQIYFRAVGLSRHHSGGIPLSRVRRGLRGHDEFLHRRRWPGVSRDRSNLENRSQRLRRLSRARGRGEESRSHRAQRARRHHQPTWRISSSASRRAKSRTRRSRPVSPPHAPATSGTWPTTTVASLFRR